ncbi:NADH dehydrogenase I subunit L [Candidatus Phycorickettsia trachydisci]|uniref:NADH-quinone oxidoreductase subunit L n=1 Tax=Candidatus Phycorickettsia trachydisci TaxID=2115978 RepID=A0A2P1P8G3_9RICK|nr:NADH-quinone oxidoreductase subunit L [Candidatus Phycorickettsia trachydisci]AVP87551.1 NADH dehydrogenase I subunit L [Candidatus Phycorickettsia trachydisci]
MDIQIAYFAPLISGLICFIFQNSLSRKSVSYIASIIMVIAAGCSTSALLNSIDNHQTVYVNLGSWIKELGVNWAIHVDHLGFIMYFVVCVISAVVHIYSIGYMHDDPRFNLFISYLSFFTFCMLVLVSADNMLQMFFGWEGVGLCSYLLIGFWFEKPSANVASIKAFVVNRLADIALIGGMLIIYSQYNSLNFSDINPNKLIETKLIFGWNLLDVTCLLLCIGAMAKSAQIGLHVWLPDAMEGPTPVSALIHAATMVTAGIFLICKMHFLFDQSSSISIFIASIGAVTALMAGMIGMLATDIKKVIAYSTSSQLGFMFMACGLKAYHAAIFHLMCHAFYKAALFLAAGNVIHATSTQDLRFIGNLRDSMRITYLFFIVASLALVGLPPFAGFYSKELILNYAFENSLWIFIVAISAAFCTAVYSAKILKSIFTGEPNNHAHEASAVMWMPMIVLIFGASYLGYYGIHHMNITEYLKDNFVVNLISENENVPYIALSFSILGCLLGYIFVKQLNSDLKGNIIKNKFYFDEIYKVLIVKPVIELSEKACRFDINVIDKVGPQKAVDYVIYFSKKVSNCHSGYLFSYSFAMIFTLFLLTTYLMLGL